MATLKEGFIETHEDTPPPAPLEGLLAAGIPLDEKRHAQLEAEDEERRQLLRSYICHDGWNWDDLYNA